MKTQFSHLFWAIGLLAVASCGGGGGGTSGGGGGGGGSLAGDVITLGGGAPPAGDYVEMIDGRAGAIDPFSLRPGSQVMLVVARYNASGSRTVLSSANWVQNGATAAQVRLTAAGALDALAVTPTPFTVSCTVGGVTYAQQMKVSNDVATIRGYVKVEGTLAALKYIEVEAVNSAGTVVAGAITGDGGFFTMRIPSGVAGISIDKNTVNTTLYYRQLRYNGRDYSTDASACPIKLTGLGTGTNNLPYSMLVLKKSTGPPPPPPNCF
jgi:hypothetical protein